MDVLINGPRSTPLPGRAREAAAAHADGSSTLGGGGGSTGPAPPPPPPPRSPATYFSQMERHGGTCNRTAASLADRRPQI
jgi:hypothetical protein